MADTSKPAPEPAQGRRKQASRLQRIAPASIEIHRPTDWNAAIPLLSPLVTSPEDNLTAEINRKETEEAETKEMHNKPMATVVATKKWQHPAAPFSYEPAPLAPFVRAAASGCLDRNHRI